jgi:hypothetical protein
MLTKEQKNAETYHTIPSYCRNRENRGFTKLRRAESNIKCVFFVYVPSTHSRNKQSDTLFLDKQRARCLFCLYYCLFTFRIS